MIDVNPLSVGCLRFLTKLHNRFENKREKLLDLRTFPPILDFNKFPKNAINGDWECSPIPEDIKDRTIEITGPAAPAKMVINALNSGANGYMADMEDSLSPTWNNILEGHKNIIKAVKGNWEERINGKDYKLNKERAVLHLRPRGLHMTEAHMFNISASLFDFGVNFFNTIYHHMATRTRPYYYIPKLEHHWEANWWASVFEFSEKYMNVSKGTIRCTILIETLPAVFQMNEILYQLKDYATGLNCGRWDYIFSMIKNVNDVPLPNRSCIGMSQNCMDAYSKLLVDTCRKRGVAAMGGMAAQVPIKGDKEANDAAMEKVKLDKIGEVIRGHDGTWVAHPGLIQLARDAWNIKIKDPFMKKLEFSVEVIEKGTKEQLLETPVGEISVGELENNVAVAIEYIANWVNGNGCVAINHLMEDAATAEIARVQVWQWLYHEKFTREQVKEKINQTVGNLTTSDNELYVSVAAKLFENLVTELKCPEFLTLGAYEQLLELEGEI